MEKMLVLDLQTTEGYCVIETYPSLGVVDVYGHGELTDADMNAIARALHTVPSLQGTMDRFIFQFPNQQSDVAFRLATFLEPRILKCAFIVPLEQRHRFKQRLFWHLCKSASIPISQLEAFRLVGRYEVKVSKRTDMPADYRFINVDPIQLTVSFDEGL